MLAKLYVGNLDYNAQEPDIRALFEKYGTVQTVDIIKDRYTGQAKGFAFVEMSNSDEAQKALELNGTPFMNRNLNVSEAKPQERRPGGGGGGRGGFGGGGGDFGGGEGRGGRDRDKKPGGGQKKGGNWKW